MIETASLQQSFSVCNDSKYIIQLNSSTPISSLKIVEKCIHIDCFFKTRFGCRHVLLIFAKHKKKCSLQPGHTLKHSLHSIPHTQQFYIVKQYLVYMYNQCCCVRIAMLNFIVNIIYYSFLPICYTFYSAHCQQLNNILHDSLPT